MKLAVFTIVAFLAVHAYASPCQITGGDALSGLTAGVEEAPNKAMKVVGSTLVKVGEAVLDLEKKLPDKKDLDGSTSIANANTKATDATKDVENKATDATKDVENKATDATKDVEDKANEKKGADVNKDVENKVTDATKGVEDKANEKKGTDVNKDVVNKATDIHVLRR